MNSVRTLLISTYDLGRQPFGLASPAAWLRRAGLEPWVEPRAGMFFDSGAVKICVEENGARGRATERGWKTFIQAHVAEAALAHPFTLCAPVNCKPIPGAELSVEVEGVGVLFEDDRFGEVVTLEGKKFAGAEFG